MTVAELFDLSLAAATETLAGLRPPVAWLSLVRAATLRDLPAKATTYDLALSLSAGAEGATRAMPEEVADVVSAIVIAQLEFLAAYEQNTDPDAVARRLEARKRERDSRRTEAERRKAATRHDAERAMVLTDPVARQVMAHVRGIRDSGSIALDTRDLAAHMKVSRSEIEPVIAELVDVGLAKKSWLGLIKPVD